MTSEALQVLNVAKGELGYKEGNNNYQKYSPAVPGLEWSQNQAWCQTFMSWCFQQAGHANLAPVTASCATAVNWYQSRNQWSWYPAVGAMVLFGDGGGDHVGIVYKFDETYIYTFAGNTAEYAGGPTDGVYERRYERRDAYVYGYGYPAYAEGIKSADPAKGGLTSASMADLDGSTPPPPPPSGATTYTVQAGDTLESIATLYGVSVADLVDWNDLINVGDVLNVAAPVDSPPETVETVYLDNVQPGKTNADVTVVQNALRAKGYTIASSENGTFGTATQAAFKQYELSIGYTDPTPPPPTTTVNLSDVQYGLTNSSVTIVQNALIHQGFSIPAGATGYFGDQTKTAYSQFQVSLGYSGTDADGNPGCTSLTTLGSRENFSVNCTGSSGGGGTANSPTAGAISMSSVSYTKNSGITNSRTVADGYANQACTKTGVPQTWRTGMSNGANLLTLIVRESSYDDNAVNTTDSNAWGAIQADGAPLHCSRGYCQTIPDTFASYHEEGTPNKIYDPVANICAAINYIRAVYGSISNVQQANPNLSPKGY